MDKDNNSFRAEPLGIMEVVKCTEVDAMTAIPGFLFTDQLLKKVCILVASDSLAIDKQADGEHICPDFQKIYRLTDHAVIGVSGKRLHLQDMASDATRLASALKNDKRADINNLSLDDISERLCIHLKETFEDKSVEADILLAGYGYKDGRAAEPGLRIIRVANGRAWSLPIDRDGGFLAVPEILKGRIEFANSDGKWDLATKERGLSQTIDIAKWALQRISDEETKQGILKQASHMEGHVGGEACYWVITPSGITTENEKLGLELPIYYDPKS